MVGIKDDYYKTLYKDFKVSTKNKVKLIKREELKEGEKLSIVSNTMFKAMFFNEKRLKYSAKLFSYLSTFSTLPNFILLELFFMLFAIIYFIKNGSN